MRDDPSPEPGISRGTCQLSVGFRGVSECNGVEVGTVGHGPKRLDGASIGECEERGGGGGIERRGRGSGRRREGRVVDAKGVWPTDGTRAGDPKDGKRGNRSRCVVVHDQRRGNRGSGGAATPPVARPRAEGNGADPRAGRARRRAHSDRRREEPWWGSPSERAASDVSSSFACLRLSPSAAIRRTRRVVTSTRATFCSAAVPTLRCAPGHRRGRPRSRTPPQANARSRPG